MGFVAKQLKAHVKRQAIKASCGVRTRAQARVQEKENEKELRLGVAAPVYLAAVLQYVVREVLELAGNCAREARVLRIADPTCPLGIRMVTFLPRTPPRISPRDIVSAASNDCELSSALARTCARHNAAL